MSDVFISYSRRDQVFARRLFERVKQDGLEGWADWEGIPYGTEWEKIILHAIDAAKSFVFIISPDSIKSDVCNVELEYARKRNKRIIPIMRREPDMKLVAGEMFGKAAETRFRDNWTFLGTINWVNFRKKSGEEFECKYDPDTRQVINPSCDGSENDADNFETAFQKLVVTLQTDQVYVDEHTRLLVRVVDWQNNKGTLLRGNELLQAEAWLLSAEDKKYPPTAEHIEFIKASRKAENTQRRRTFTILSSLLVLAVVLAMVSFISYQNANIEKNRADSNAARAFEAQTTAERSAQINQSIALGSAAEAALNDGNQPLAVSLALDAVSIPTPPVVAQRALNNQLYLPGLSRQITGNWSLSTQADYSADGRKIVIGTSSGIVLLVDAASGNELKRFGSTMRGVIDRVAFSLDETQIMASSETDRRVIVWDIKTGSEVRHWGEFEFGWGHAFSPDGSLWIHMDAVGGSNGAVSADIVLINTATGEEIKRIPLKDLALDDATQAISPDNRWLLLGGAMEAEFLKQVRLVDLLNGNQYLLRDTFGTVAIAADSRTALITNREGIEVWDLLRRERLSAYPLPFASGGYVAFIANSPNIVHIAPGNIRIINLDQQREVFFAKVPGANNWVTISPDRHHMLLTGSNNTFSFFDIDSSLKTYLADIDARIVQSRFLSTDQTIFASSNDGYARLWDKTGKLQFSQYLFEGPIPYGSMLETDVDDKDRMVAGVVNSVQTWDLSQKKQLGEWNIDNDIFIANLASQPKSNNVVIYQTSPTYDQHNLALYDAISGSEQFRFNPPRGVFLANDLEFAADGETFIFVYRIMAGDNVNSACLVRYSVHKADMLNQSCEPNSFYVQTRFVSKTDQIITSTLGGDLLVHDSRTLKLDKKLVGHDTGVTALAPNPLYPLLASGDGEGTINVWDLQQGSVIFTLPTTNNPVRAIDWSSDGQSLLTGGDDGEIHVWHIFPQAEQQISWLYNNRLVPNLSCDERAFFPVRVPCVDGAAPTATVYPTVNYDPQGLISNHDIAAVTPIPTYPPRLNAYRENLHIENNDDVNLFSFNAHQNDVLTIRVDSNFQDDLQIALQMPNGDFEWSDQANIQHDVDAAIENRLLPRDGTYYLAIRSEDTSGANVSIEVLSDSQNSDVQLQPIERGLLGITYDLRAGQGAEVTKVVAGSPSGLAGLQEGDIITAINGFSVIDEPRHILVMAFARPVGEKITLNLKRNNQNFQLDVVPATRNALVATPTPVPTTPSLSSGEILAQYQQRFNTLVFDDEFDDNHNNWVLNRKEETVITDDQIKDGIWTHTSQQLKNYDHFVFSDNDPYLQNGMVELKVRVDDLAASAMGLVVRYRDDRYWWYIQTPANRGILIRDGITLVANQEFKGDLTQWTTLKVIFDGPLIFLFVDDQLVLDYEIESVDRTEDRIGPGNVAVVIYNGSQGKPQTVYLDSYRVYSDGSPLPDPPK